MDAANARRKVRALLRVAAVGSGATAEERATAALLAASLLAQHGLLDATVELPHPRGALGSFTFTVFVGGA